MFTATLLRCSRSPYAPRITLRYKSYSSTVLLPKTTFKASLEVGKEVKLQEDGSLEGLYERQSNSRKDKQTFIIHDGPPYANGDPHLGHAVNKILKDFICKYQIQRGNRVEFVPGWDCHGLPIELKASSSTSEADPISTRTGALKFAEETIEHQRKVFKRWGVTADWNNPYLTYDMKYIEQELRSFYHLYSKGLVYRDRLPVFWSLDYKTALAEAELEYNHEHKSTAAFVKFPIVSPSNDKLHALIWTSTPWTLLSNQSIGYSLSIEYSIVKIGNDKLIIARNLIDKLKDSLGTEITVIEEFNPEIFKTLKYQHPFKDGDFGFIECPFVTDDKGTGLVHLAPNHGRDDFVACLRNNITPEELFVDESGCFTSSAGPKLQFKQVLTEGNEEMLNMFSNFILKEEDLIHSYPYDWRSKKPVIIRSSQQWFFDIQDLKSRCMEQLTCVNFVPRLGSKQLERQLLDRPYWCISRQRSWGVPIPVFYRSSDHDKKDPVFDESILELVIENFKAHGVSSWWTSQVSDLIQTDDSIGRLSSDNLVKSNDILDIWFDSGISWLPVIPENTNGRIADVYLEGIDQFNGWFLSSLITSTAIQGRAPFKSIYVHGFLLDSEGKKMSKSLGNVIDPMDIVSGNKRTKIEPFGADVLRYWVLEEANTHSNVRFDLTSMSRCKEFVFKIRKLLRFCIGSLQNFKQEKCLDFDQIFLTEKVMLNFVYNFHAQFETSMDELDFKQVSKLIRQVIEELSSFYLPSCKNRLYCSPENSRERKSVQTVLFHILRILLQDLSFVLPHLCQDTYSHVSELGLIVDYSKSSVFEVNWFTPPSNWSDADLGKLLEVLSEVRDQVNKFVPIKSKSKTDLKLSIGSEELNLLKRLQAENCEVDQLADVLDLARVSLEELTTAELEKLVEEEKSKNQVLLGEEEIEPDESGPKMKLYSSETTKSLCLRCRRYTALSSDLCERCTNCIRSLTSNFELD